MFSPSPEGLPYEWAPDPRNQCYQNLPLVYCQEECPSRDAVRTEEVKGRLQHNVHATLPCLDGEVHREVYGLILVKLRIKAMEGSALFALCA